MIDQPQAVWLNGGTPKDAKKQAKKIVKAAADQHAVPVLVAYNIPFRDCAQFSAGGATTKQEYFDWIDAVADGIGKAEAVVMLEPDSLGIIPWYNPFASRETWLTIRTFSNGANLPKPIRRRPPPIASRC